MEQISIFDIFKIGVGPSSSHTLGPWKAALEFTDMLKNNQVLSVDIELYGSLSKTGKGHGTDVAVIMGLQGFDPETVDTNKIPDYIEKVNKSNQLLIANQYIYFNPSEDIIYREDSLPYHPNALTFRSLLSDNSIISETYYSVGGGFIVKEADKKQTKTYKDLPYPINTERDLDKYTESTNLSISEIVFENELQFNSKELIRKKILKLWDIMVDSIYLGCSKSGTLPGGLNVKRKAKHFNDCLLNNIETKDREEWIKAIKACEPTFNNINKWISCFAIAVNEENASMGRIVTSPTNGASGVIPAVLMYHYCFGNYKGEDDIIEFFLTAGEIASLFKKGATISGAMGGCQAEIGVSSAMAAAGLADINGGTPDQVLEAAEIAMEHHLGLTCDPVGGLVQVPCIERNAMGAIKAVTASNLALSINPENAVVNLDTVIKTMWETAKDMNIKYKETSEGGLAINIPVLPNC
ncbi:MAG: L-serine ammonia-lyase [Bacteroidales bacterium]|nr:L-serine ammonia-lyase [Bacteroidales bacterium]